MEPFMTELELVLRSMNTSYEIIVVDDASTDATSEKLASLNLSSLRVIRMERNSGHSVAMWTGMAAALGQYIVTLHGDMQHPPSLIPKMIEKMNQMECQVIYGIRNDFEVESLFKRTTSRLFFIIVRYLYGIRLEPYANDFRVIRREVLDLVITRYKAFPSLRAILPQLGLATTTIAFDLRNRLGGKSKFTIRKMVVLFLDTIKYAKRLRILSILTSGLFLITLSLFWTSFSPAHVIFACALSPLLLPYLWPALKKQRK